MIFLRKFNEHSSYETELSGGGVDISLPNVSYCEDVKDVHYTPYNLVRFYVGEVPPTQTVSIYTDSTNHLDVSVSEGNKWYSYMLPKDKGLFKIVGDSVKKVVVKVDIVTEAGETIIPYSTVEASFKGSNTTNVTDMHGMFSFCNDLTSLDLSGWNTNNVNNMGAMFQGCSSLTSLTLNSFDTSNVTYMNSMFSGCNGLTSLDVSNFDTSNVNNMGSMFDGCNGLTSLDVSNFNTTNVINMNGMFWNCRGLTSLDVSNFNTTSVTDMGAMFDGCSSLTSLTLNSFDTSNVYNMNGMFSNCFSLKTIRMVGCSPDTVEKIKTELKTDGLSENIVQTE